MVQIKTQLDKYGFPINSPASPGNLPAKEVPWEYGQRQKIQTKQIKLSSVNIRRPIFLSSGASVTGTIAAGSTSIITNTLTPLTPHANEINFAIPFVAIFQGTAAIITNQIWPALGASGTWGNWTIQAGMDFVNFSTTIPGSVNSNFVVTLHNNQAVSGTFFYESQFKFLQYNSGTNT